MIKIIIMTLFLVSSVLANNQNISLLNDIKKVVQKEEYISLAINKYIIENNILPFKLNDSDEKVIDWDELATSDYLGEDFNKINPYTSKEMEVYLKDGFVYIKGAIEDENDYNSEHKFLYNYYIDQINRVNTYSPIDNTKENLVKGSLIKYEKLQKEIVKVLEDYEEDNTKATINSTDDCVYETTFYELDGDELTLKYCISSGESINVYSDGENLVINDEVHLKIIEAPIGTKAYVKKDSGWSEYYYQGKVETEEWIERTVTSAGDSIGSGDSDGGDPAEIGVVPGDKILVLRNNVGCYLVGGDISCWGDNSFNKFGVDTSANPNSDILEIPVMLKTELESFGLFDWFTTWNNSAYREKYKAVAVNSKDVCAISTNNELFCSGNYSGTSYLKQIYENISSVAMTDSAIAIVTTSGDLYTKGVNLDGVLGSNSTSDEYNTLDFSKVGSGFKEVFSLSATRTFGATDSSDKFWIWGQRSEGNLYVPTKIESTSSISEVFINPSEFVLKTSTGSFIRTDKLTQIASVENVSDVKSIASTKVGSETETLYVKNSGELVHGNSELFKCKNSNGTDCSSTQSTIFDNAIGAIEDYSSIHVYGSMTGLGLVEPVFNHQGGVFNGDDNSGIVVEGTEDFNITGNALTLSAYITPNNDSSDYNYIFSNGGGYGTDGFQVVQRDQGIRFEINHNAFDVNNVLEDGVKNFITVTYDGEEINIYVDAQNVYTKSYTGGVGLYNNNIEIGGNPFRDNLDFNGEISDVRVFDVALTAEQVYATYTENSSSSSSSFELDTTFDEWGGITSTSFDRSPSNGDDIIYVNGDLDSDMKLKNGNDQLEIKYNSNKDVIGDNGNDKIKINGNANDKVDLGNGNDELVIMNDLNGSKNNKSETLKGGNGDDLITIKNNVNIDIDTGNDDDKIQIFGDLNKDLETDNGNDDVYIAGNVNGLIDTQKDNDRVRIEGDVNKDIDLGDGDDIIQVDSNVYGNIDGEKGTNSIFLKYYTKSQYESNYNSLKTRLSNFDNFLFKDGEVIGDSSVFGGYGDGGTTITDTSTVLTETDKFICVVSKEKSTAKLYCWGNITNRIPLLSTSLIKDSKIDLANNYLYNSSEDVLKQKTYDEYFNNGEIYLKYPTYIGAFDYDFKFR